MQALQSDGVQSRLPAFDRKLCTEQNELVVKINMELPFLQPCCASATPPCISGCVSIIKLPRSFAIAESTLQRAARVCMKIALAGPRAFRRHTQLGGVSVVQGVMNQFERLFVPHRRTRE